MFLGRFNELEELNKRYNSNKFEFGFIYGTRRIGKTSLLHEFVKDKKNIFFQARQVNDHDNLVLFSKEVAKCFSLPQSFTFSDFDSALQYIADNIGDEKLVMILDEYPYFNNEKNGYSSYLQDFIDNKVLDKKIKLVLAGSNISSMKELQSNSSPLFQRNTFQMKLTKMPFNEAALFLKGINVEDKVKYLSLFGTFPYYLAMIDKTKSFKENVYNLLFSKYGTLQNAPENILSQTIRTQTVYNSILFALANRKKTVKEIANVINEGEAKVAKYLITLVDSEIVDKRNAFNGNKKTIYYVISDPLILFWYRFILNNKEDISLGIGKNIFDDNKDKINDYIARSFEDVAISYMEYKDVMGELSHPYHSFKNYKVDNSKLGRSIEIDGISDYKDNLLVIECKYRKEKFSMAMFNHLKESVSIFDGYKHIEYYLFSKSGFEKELKSLKDVHLIEPKDMFEDVK